MDYRSIVLAVFVLCACAVQPAWADWQDVADEHAGQNAVVEDNPAWDEYAFTLEFADGSGELSFVDLARSGQPFILFFWLTDCPVCHLQLPYVQQLDRQSKEDDLGIRVVSINLDDDPRECLDFADEKAITFELLTDGRARRTDKAFHLRDLGTPVAYVFNADGLLVDYLTGFHGQFTKNVMQLLDLELPRSSGA